MKIIKILLTLVWYPFFAMIYTIFFSLGSLAMLITYKSNKNWALVTTVFIADKLEELTEINNRVKQNK